MGKAHSQPKIDWTINWYLIRRHCNRIFISIRHELDEIRTYDRWHSYVYESIGVVWLVYRNSWRLLRVCVLDKRSLMRPMLMKMSNDLATNRKMLYIWTETQQYVCPPAVNQCNRTHEIVPKMFSNHYVRSKKNGINHFYIGGEHFFSSFVWLSCGTHKFKSQHSFEWIISPEWRWRCYGRLIWGESL